MTLRVRLQQLDVTTGGTWTGWPGSGRRDERGCNNGFVTMLAPLRGYLSPKDPRSSPLLYTTKGCYFTRLSVDTDPDQPNFGETRWIISEDVNVEHLLDGNLGRVWTACADFMWHLVWHKNRHTVLKSKIEGLPGDHPSKAECLILLSQLFLSVGNYVECKQQPSRSLKIVRKQGNNVRIAPTCLVPIASWASTRKGYNR